MPFLVFTLYSLAPQMSWAQRPAYAPSFTQPAIADEKASVETPTAAETTDNQIQEKVFQQPQQRSKWGLGLGFGWLPDYPGAENTGFHFLPFPIYRGDRFRMDRLDGITGRVGNTSMWKLSWNFAFQFPTPSKKIRVRQSMANLDWLLSIGPMIQGTLWQSGKHRLVFRAPVRANLCTNFSKTWDFCGVSFNPGFRFHQDLEEHGNLIYRIEAFADTWEYNQYFYGVSAEDALPWRPAYKAAAGFLGWVAGVIHTWPLGSWDLVTALSYYDYSLSTNKASPLFLKPHNFSAFFALSIDL